MIVDDNDFNIVPLQTMIKKNYNLECMTASNGLEGVNKFRDALSLACGCRHRVPFLIIMDLGMPIMNG